MPWQPAESRRSRRLPLKLSRRGLGSQSLEPRLALTFSSFETVASTLHPVAGAPIPAEVTFVNSKELLAGGPTIHLRSDILTAPEEVVRSVVFGEIGHHLDTTLPVTDALVTGQTVLDPFTIQLIDNNGAMADATAVFTIDGADTPSACTANVAGYAAVSIANPTLAALGVLDPANTLVISIPAEAGVISILNVQWEWLTSRPTCGSRSLALTPSPISRMTSTPLLLEP